MLDSRAEETSLDFGSGNSETAKVTRRKVLGRGRAAHAVLVDVRTPAGVRQVVEKHFAPAGLTKAIYKFFFGAPFPYGVNRDAVLACLHRRRVAGALLKAEEGFRVAEAYYVRQCSGGHWVLGTEWIRGRPVAPPKPKEGPEGGSEPGEMHGLLRQMKAMERCLLRAGLTGSGWQVATLALVSTANLLRTPEGEFICIDLESGIPALLAPRYLLLSLTGQPFPLFDDVDAKKLRRYLAEQRESLRAKLGANEFSALEASAEKLIHHSRLWKRTEPAPGRHRTALLTDADLRSTVRSSLADRWVSEKRLDTNAASGLRRSKLLFLHPLVILGMLPTAAGTLLHRLAGNREFRSRFFRALFHPLVLDAELREFQGRKTADLVREHRIPSSGAERLQQGLRSLFPFLVQSLAGSVFPARLHRFLADWSELGAALKVAFLALVSEKIQKHLAYSFVEHATARWCSLGRLDEAGRDALIREIRTGEAPEYARGFGAHLALKFFEPVTSGLKVLGIGFIATHPWNPLGYVLIVNTSVFRVLITTYRWLRRHDRNASFAVAFVISPIPIFGTLAFPFQFYHRRPWLGRFLARSSMSRIAGSIPIYGGSGTRPEHGLVRLSTPLTAVVAAVIWPLKWIDLRRSSSEAQEEKPAQQQGTWMAPQIDRALAWLSRTEEAEDPCLTASSLPSRCSNRPTTRRN